jgi:dihydrofolate synthase/folylpolyglutamate synthase
VPGRLQEIGQTPLTLVDGAHNTDGMRALTESLPELVRGHDRLIAMLSILDDKDAAGMLAILAPVCDAIVFTSSQNPRALPPPTLQSLATQIGGPPSEIVPDPVRALSRARELAGTKGVVIVAGSLYLVADLLISERRQRASML